MNRRKFAQIAILTLGTMSGCIGTADKQNTSRSGLKSSEFKLIKNSPFKCFGDAVILKNYPDENKVEVIGQIESSGRSCKTTVLESAVFDEESSTLEIVVSDKSTGGNSCTAEEASVPYQVSIVTQKNNPNKVEITHKDIDNNVNFDKSFSISSNPNKSEIIKKTNCT